VQLARAAVCFVLLAVAAVLEVTVLARIPFPGATPDLVLLVVVALGLAGGPITGATAGFVGGLLLDAMPPSDGTLGVWALVLTVVGLLAGRAQDAAQRSVFMPLLVVAVLAPAALLGYTGLSLLLGDPRVVVASLATSLPAVTLYDVLLAPFVVPVVGRIYRRVGPRVATY
jgi:rod shape-determining protein MreD